MKKIITGACILLVSAMFSPAMAQDGPNKQPDRQADRINKHIDRQGRRYDDRRIDRGKNYWRGQNSTRFANPRGYRGNHMYTRHNNRHQRHMYYRFNNRHQRHMYSMHNHWHHRHRNHW